VTSIAEPTRDGADLVPERTRGRRATWVRPLLLVALLALLALFTEPPWAWLWLAVPGALAASLLTTWRFGAMVVAVVSLLAAALAVLTLRQPLWAWWISAGALTGAWMGAREEGAGPGPGQRAWMMAPVLVLGAALPWLPGYGVTVAAIQASIATWGVGYLDVLRQVHTSADNLASVEKSLALIQQGLPNAFPTVLFLWAVLLVAAGRGLAGRVADALRWPRLSRERLVHWRLPDVALWVLIGGLALLLTPWPAWAPTGWTLLLAGGLAFCMQGVAVVESLFLARGIPPAVVLMTLLFIFVIAMPAFVLSTAVVGLSDAWLDFRRLEPVHDGDRNLGDH
jgi:hypothetical protein